MLLEAEAQHLQMVQAKLRQDRVTAVASASVGAAGTMEIDDEL